MAAVQRRGLIPSPWLPFYLFPVIMLAVGGYVLPNFANMKIRFLVCIIVNGLFLLFFVLVRSLCVYPHLY
jgi:hypothetical protein